jgi:hypothetical protein
MVAHKFDHHYSVYHLYVANNTAGNGPIPHLSSARCDEQYQFAPALTRTVTLAASGVEKHAGHQMVGRATALERTGDPAPSGLNCGANSWP